MTVVGWQDIRVRVRIVAKDVDSLNACLSDIQREVTRVAGRKTLVRKYHLPQEVEVISTRIEPFNVARLIGDSLEKS